MIAQTVAFVKDKPYASSSIATIWPISALPSCVRNNLIQRILVKAKIDTLRAVLASVAQRILRTAMILGIVLFGVVLIIIWLLSHFFSNWWWLLLIIYLPLLLVSLVAWLIARLLSRTLYPQRISPEQKVLINAFTDKIQRLLEARGMGWPMLAMLNIRDLLFYRELRTTKKLIADTSSLKRDFAELENKLQSEFF